MNSWRAVSPNVAALSIVHGSSTPFVQRNSLWFCDVVTNASSAHHAVRARLLPRALPFPSASVCFEVLLPHGREAPSLLSPSTPPNSCDIPSSIFCSFHFVKTDFLLHLCTMLPVSQACRKRFDRALSMPAAHWTCVHNPLFASTLISVQSRVFRMCGSFSSSTTVFAARTTFCIELKSLTTLALLDVMHLRISHAF